MGLWTVTTASFRADGAIAHFDQVTVNGVPGPDTANIAILVSGPDNVGVFQLDTGPYGWSTDNNRAFSCWAGQGGPFCELTVRIGATLSLQASGPYEFSHWRAVDGEPCDSVDAQQQTCTITVRRGGTLRAVFVGYPD